MKNNFPFVSILIVVYNEEKFIKKCIESILTQDYPKDKYELIIIDGLSTDNTRSIIEKIIESNPTYKIRLIDNPEKKLATGWNIGVKASKGEVIIRIDGHSYVVNNFIKKNIEYLAKVKDADCVGGIIETINDSLMGKVISLAMSSPFGVGSARFRTGNYEGYVDTVAFGAYRKEVFDKIGLFDEELVRNQDDEFNYRLIKSGGKILLIPKIKSYYYCRTSFKKLWQQYYQYGYWKVRVIQKHKFPASLRHLVPITFVLSLIASGCLALFSKIGVFLLSFILATYLLTSLAFSIKIALKEGLRFLPILPIAFACIHFSYGIGFLKGILDFMILKKHLKQKIKDVKLTR